MLVSWLQKPFPTNITLAQPGTNKENSIQQRHLLPNVENNRYHKWQPGHKNNCRVVYFVWILTCCIIFQFEASSSYRKIRMKMNEEVVA